MAPAQMTNTSLERVKGFVTTMVILFSKLQEKKENTLNCFYFGEVVDPTEAKVLIP